ncbi:hypothetical protein CHU95_03990 [Niveispirillum lacus]|uniref:DUF4276 family protein n=1 Tax=Niveispirillum lacus TaxID=1981099 RepID=A0A255Z4F9_9PROT|nr:hypothetical protein [Niveispirillum lacus]OYQ36403.1 hypothetical protein CHU95_03990 [Niveispirillum lacus]
MNLLIIPEDHTNDQYILKPLFQALLKQNAKRQGTVEIYPVRGGRTIAMRIETIRQAVREYSWGIDHFILCMDRDGDLNRAAKIDHLCRQVGEEFGDRVSFLGGLAHEELETWLLAGLPKEMLPDGVTWQDIRTEISVKERHFAPVAALAKAADGPGGGRQRLGIEAARSIQAIRQKCREDFDELARRLEAKLVL